jgi:hypothetical protein
MGLLRKGVGVLVGSSVHGTKPSYSVKDEKFLEELNDW